MILLKKGKAHNTINGTMPAVAVERDAADTVIEMTALSLPHLDEKIWSVFR